MKSFICLALSCLLIGLLYVYMRQQFAAQNMQIGQLKQLVTTMAQEFQQGHCKNELEATPDPVGSTIKKIITTQEHRVTVSDDSESEDDDEAEDDEEYEEEEEDEAEDVEVEVEVEVTVKEETKVQKLENTLEIDESMRIEVDDLSDSTNEPIVLDISEQTKTINLFEESPPVPKKAILEKLSVKELKEMVSSKGGPSLKTKKEMVEFLEKL
jgi:hypothetical protein